MDVNICLSGGGTRLAAHLGALQCIREQGGRVQGWAGASAGSLVSAVLASGYTHEMAVDLMSQTNYRQFLDVRPIGLLRGYGLCAGRKFENWLDGILEGKRFEDLDVPLVVVCTDIQTGEPFLFSRENTPQAKVATSVRCSIGIPGVFTVRRMHGGILIDGSLATVNDDLLFPGSPNRTLTIRLVRNQAAKLAQTKGFGLATYVHRVAGMLLDAADEPSVPADKWENTLLVRTGHHSSVNFDLSQEERQELYQMGYEQCKKYIDLNQSTPLTMAPTPKPTLKKYCSLNDLAEDAVKLARDTSRVACSRNNKGISIAPQPPEEPTHNQPSTLSGLGFEAL